MTGIQLAERRSPVALGRVIVAFRLCAWAVTGAVLAGSADLAILGAAAGSLAFVLCATLWAAMRRWVDDAPSEEWLRFRRLFTWPASVTLILLEVCVFLNFLRFAASAVMGAPGLPAFE